MLSNSPVLLVVILILFGCASVSQNETSNICPSKKALTDIAGSGESKAVAIENFRDNARNACYELCKQSSCNSDAKDGICSIDDPKSRCCSLEKWTSENDQPVRDATGFWNLVNKVTCNCRCSECGNKDAGLVYALPIESGIKSDRIEAEGEALEWARSWCSKNECARFTCQEGKKCVGTSVNPARQLIKSPSEDPKKFISTYVIESCECSCK
jgi:hypothetical protein